MDTVALLQHEHDAVRALFGRLPAVSGPERLESVREIAARVVLHLQLEEEFLYRALEQAGDVEARRAAADARADHALVDDLIERLLRLDPRERNSSAPSASSSGGSGLTPATRRPAPSPWLAGRWASRAWKPSDATSCADAPDWTSSRERFARHTTVSILLHPR
jgi:hypothetical protein